MILNLIGYLIFALGAVFMSLYGVYCLIQLAIERSNVAKDLKAIRRLLTEIRDKECDKQSGEDKEKDSNL